MWFFSVKVLFRHPTGIPSYIPHSFHPDPPVKKVPPLSKVNVTILPSFSLFHGQSEEVSFSWLSYIYLSMSKIGQPSVLTLRTVKTLDDTSDCPISGTFLDYDVGIRCPSEGGPSWSPKKSWKLTNLLRVEVAPPLRRNEF